MCQRDSVWAMCHMDSLQTVSQVNRVWAMCHVGSVCIVSRGQCMGTLAECGQCHVGKVWAMSRGQCVGNVSRDIAHTLPT